MFEILISFDNKGAKGHDGINGEKGDLGHLGDKGNRGKFGEKGENGPSGEFKILKNRCLKKQIFKNFLLWNLKIKGFI